MDSSLPVKTVLGCVFWDVPRKLRSYQRALKRSVFQIKVFFQGRFKSGKSFAFSEIVSMFFS
jgi:hypothetical protein